MNKISTAIQRSPNRNQNLMTPVAERITEVISISKDSEVVDVNFALKVAESRHGISLPMVDSLIAATCFTLKAMCVCDDPHFAGAHGLSKRWI